MAVQEQEVPRSLQLTFFLEETFLMVKNGALSRQTG
jgi:hypothetical protein